MNLVEAINAQKPFFAAGKPDIVYVGADDHGSILKLKCESGGTQRVSLQAMLADYEIVEERVTLTRSQLLNVLRHTEVSVEEHKPTGKLHLASWTLFEMAKALGFEVAT